ncbi:MAG: peptide-methionine (S)-S-oxide reductase MsrA [Pseudomonadota bacterium]
MRLTHLTLAAALTIVGLPAQAETRETAIFAGGCFWCVESDFDKIDGVLETVSGYIGGHLDNPTYKQVVREDTGHYEAVQITYDADLVSYETLVHAFWRSVNPTDPGGQFCDRGDSYRTAVFAIDDAQRGIAEASKQALDESGVLDAPVVTPILDAAPFWPAEDYHQDYDKKNPLRYSFYRLSCGRDAEVRAVWGDEALTH